MKSYESWGRYPKAVPAGVEFVHWQHDGSAAVRRNGPVLPYALGRSYGDSCLNDGGVLLDTTGLARFIAFDLQTGLLRCEAGVTLFDVLRLCVPQGWFLPVTPGTKFVSIGGAIANDVHGKNHHRAGTFGTHVRQLELIRSDGQRQRCSAHENAELFRATIGGLGLTGLILWAEFQLKRIRSPWVLMDSRRFDHLEEFFALSQESDEAWEYTVAWVDCTVAGKQLGRGVFLRGNHAEAPRSGPPMREARLMIPVDMPAWVLNRPIIRLFNEVYWRRHPKGWRRRLVHYETFFYPLDTIRSWNRLYGKRGFLQYQFVVPLERGREVVRTMLERVATAKMASFLAVLKLLGRVSSPGLLSFPMPGLTLALDFANRGRQLYDLLDELDELVAGAGGRVYPAKDARMSARHFQAFYPQWQEFTRHVDPRFSSSFWRRVTCR